MTPFAVGGPYQVELAYYYPNLNSPFYDGGGVATIGPSVEYPYAFYGYWSVNLKLRKMTITFQVTFWCNCGVEFLGIMVISLTSGANLPQPAYFISYTTANPGTLTSTATTIALDWQCLSFNQGEEIVIGW